MNRSGRSAGSGDRRKPPLEPYKPKSKLRAGEFVTVFESDGDVKLLPASALLPADQGLKKVTVLAREFLETFDPQYGSGPSPIAGRFALQRYNGSEITFFGWALSAP